MSRIIEPGKKLTSFERQYLQDRGIDPDAYENVDADDDLVEEVHDEQTATIADKDRIIGELQERIVALEAENAVLRQQPRDLTAEPKPVRVPETEESSDDTSDENDTDEDGVERRPADGETGEGDDEADVPYTEWTNDELRAEIKNRNQSLDEADQMSTDGKKADLIARLEADDANEDDAP